MRAEAIIAAAKDRKEAARFLDTAACLLMTHMKNRACLRSNGANPADLQKLSAHISNCHDMLKTATWRYLRTL